MVFACLLGTISIEAQNKLFHFADSLYNIGNFEKAAFEYEKISFYNPNDSIRNHAYLRRAFSFKSLGKHFEAYQNFIRIDMNSFDDSSKCSINYQTGLMLYLSSYYKDANVYLQRNFNLNINTLEYRHSILLDILVLNELNIYNEAKNKLAVYSNNYASPSQRESLDLTNIYNKEELPKLVSLNKARRLSKVIPGAGLFYIGKPGRALSNIGFLLASLGYTGLNAYAGNYITSATAGVHMVRLFYIGGLNQLNELVPVINKNRALDFNDRVKNKLICLF